MSSNETQQVLVREVPLSSSTARATAAPSKRGSSPTASQRQSATPGFRDEGGAGARARSRSRSTPRTVCKVWLTTLHEQGLRGSSATAKRSRTGTTASTQVPVCMRTRTATRRSMMVREAAAVAERGVHSVAVGGAGRVRGAGAGAP